MGARRAVVNRAKGYRCQDGPQRELFSTVQSSPLRPPSQSVNHSGLSSQEIGPPSLSARVARGFSLPHYPICQVTSTLPPPPLPKSPHPRALLVRLLPLTLSMSASTTIPTLKPSASTSANNWDPLELWLDFVCLDSCDSNEQLHMDDSCNINMGDSAAFPSAPTVAYFQSKATLEDFATFDFGDSLFVSNLDAITTTSSLPSLNDSFFDQALEKSANLLSMKVSSSSSTIAPVESANASGAQSSPSRTLKRPAKSLSTNNLKKPRLCALNNSSTTKATKNTKATTAELKLQVRKVKQRGYERTYRGRLRTRRAEDEALWMTLEAQLRAMLEQKSAVCAPESYALLRPSSSSGSLALECIEMAHHLRALQEEKAFWTALDKWIGALNMWGGETEASRSIRYQINALQKLPYSPAFVNFTW